jgi:hypothetical protein
LNWILNGAVLKKTAANLVEYLSITILVCLVISSFQAGFLNSYTTPSFSFKEITVNYENISPADNGSYTGDVPLNISVRFYAFSQTKSGVIPYQEISCLYRLDNGEWQNTTLNNASKQGYSGYPINRIWAILVDCNYTATLQDLTNGVHILDVDFQPNLGGILRLSSNGTLIASERSQYNHSLPTNASIIFYVFGNEIKPTSTPQNSEEEQALFLDIVIMAIAVIVAIVFGLLVYFKKHRSKILSK